MYPRFISVFLANQLKNVPGLLDHFPINALTSKVLTFMVKKGKNFSGNVTPLFNSMLVQPTKDEGEVSERPSESQPIPTSPYPSEDQHESQPDPSLRPSSSIPTPDSNPKGSSGNHGAKEIKDLKAQIKQLKKKAKPGRKTAKSKPTVHKDQAFDDLDELDAMDYMETKDAHNEERTSSKTEELKTCSKTKELNFTVKPDEGTDKPKVSTDKIDEGTAEPKDEGTDEAPTTTSTPTSILNNVEDIERPRPTSTRLVLTLKPLPKIDPKAKGKGMIKEEDESDTESEDITEAEKKFKMLANDEEMARKVQEEWKVEEEKERLAEEEATKAAFTNEFEVTRNKLPSRTQLRNQMMTYLKHVGGKKHSDLKTKIFEEIQVLYKKEKRSDENFIAICSVKDERLIKDLNKKVADTKKADSIKEENKEEGAKKRKLGTRKKMKLRKRKFRQNTSEDDETNSEKENDELRLCLTIAPDEDKEVDYEILDKKYPITKWKSEYIIIKPQYDETKDIEEINLNVVD
ncbi:hypothetical protein Tco_0843606 [Tanacetum coccineum]|uniref:Uncharacterized protein n=1 Tax=Tanacetum coccineum TaxID=301880 RepID=A0ABQ5B8C7_9ASTR